MTYKEFISKLKAYSFCMLHFEKASVLNFKKESEEYLILYIESELPIAALSLVDDVWKFDRSTASFDATWLRTMAELADTPKEQRGDWE